MKKRYRKKTCYYIYEGKTEGYFLHYLASLFPNASVKEVSPFSGRGGTADSIVLNALSCQYYDRLFVLLDEDFESKAAEYRISNETLRKLEQQWNIDPGALSEVKYRDLHKYNINHRKPVIIVSNPQAIEGLLLQILGYSKQQLESKTTTELKNMLQNLLGPITDIHQSATTQEALLHLFHNKMPLSILQEKRKNISELDTLLSFFE